MRHLLRILLACVIAIPALFAMPVAVSASPTVTIYDNDWTGWNNAVGGVYLTEDFNDTTLNPGLSVVSDLGHILVTQGLWWDQLNYDLVNNVPTTFTTWTFAVPIYAFGGTWDAGSSRVHWDQGHSHSIGGPGSNIEVLINGNWVSVGVIDNQYIDVFWGFVSDVPFTQVRLQAYNAEGWTERHTLENMVYSVLESFVTGGGKIGSKKPVWTFGGNVGATSGGTPIGQFQINDHVNKVSYHTTEITALAFSGDPATTPDATCNTATFTANFRGNDGSTKTVTVTIKDLGEKAPKMDTIQLSGDLVLAETLLSGGNFQVHESR